MLSSANIQPSRSSDDRHQSSFLFYGRHHSTFCLCQFEHTILDSSRQLDISLLSFRSLCVNAHIYLTFFPSGAYSFGWHWISLHLWHCQKYSFLGSISFARISSEHNIDFSSWLYISPNLFQTNFLSKPPTSLTSQQGPSDLGGGWVLELRMELSCFCLPLLIFLLPPPSLSQQWWGGARRPYSRVGVFPFL